MGKPDASNTTLLPQGLYDQGVRHFPGEVENIRRLDGFDKLIRRSITSAPVDHAQERSRPQLVRRRKESIDDIRLHAKVANKTNPLSLANRADFQSASGTFQNSHRLQKVCRHYFLISLRYPDRSHNTTRASRRFVRLTRCDAEAIRPHTYASE